MKNQPGIEELVLAVTGGQKYRHMLTSLVRRIGEAELAKGRSWKEAVKATRSRLHQTGTAYLDHNLDFSASEKQLHLTPPSLTDPSLQAFCRGMMACHASTRERLPILEIFFHQTLAGLAPVDSILDLACGLNPLALPWMPLKPGAAYHACDIFRDLAGFLNRFFAHTRVNGEAFNCDLTTTIPDKPVQLALLLKTLPCLEQLDRLSSARLLESIPARHLLVSFPVASLGGRSKNMPQNYERHFLDLVAGKPWHIQRFEFNCELAFLVSRQ